jgi:F-type H+-transporting ATPase subunit alpha
METAIHRGHILQEILKQDRLSPLSAEFQMAWLVAFNDGLFENIDLEGISEVLTQLEKSIQHISLKLESPRDEWSAFVKSYVSNNKEDEPK